MAEPPAGTMLIELLDGERGVPALRMITPQGWTEPDRRQTLIANLVPLPATLRSAAPILAAPLRASSYRRLDATKVCHRR